jgi:predicted dehydrogenase
MGLRSCLKQFHLDVQEDQLKDGARPGDKDFGEEPESHFGMYRLPTVNVGRVCKARSADDTQQGTLTTMSDGAPTRSTVPTVQPPTYVEYYRVLAKALRGEGESPVKPEGARDVLRIIEAAIESSKESRTIAL